MPARPPPRSGCRKALGGASLRRLPRPVCFGAPSSSRPASPSPEAAALRVRASLLEPVELVEAPAADHVAQLLALRSSSLRWSRRPLLRTARSLALQPLRRFLHGDTDDGDAPDVPLDPTRRTLGGRLAPKPMSYAVESSKLEDRAHSDRPSRSSIGSTPRCRRSRASLAWRRAALMLSPAAAAQRCAKAHLATAPARRGEAEDPRAGVAAEAEQQASAVAVVALLRGLYLT